MGQRRLAPRSDNSINTAIRKIRRALGEDSDNPQYIETVPGKGYRLKIAVVRANGNGESRLVPDVTGDVIPHVAPNKVEAATANSSAGSIRVRKVSRRLPDLRLTGVITGVAVALFCLAIWKSLPQPPTVSRIVRITNDGKTKNPLNPLVTDGVHLYFTEGLPYTSGSGIAQVSAAGGETTWITTTLRDVWAVNPVSPDHSELLVAKGATVGTESVIQLWVQPLPAGTPHRVGDFNALMATWMPDGTHILYSDGNGILKVNNDGSDPHQLAKTDGIVFAMRYSPDGRRIRFDHTDPRTDSNSIWEMDADGRDMHPVFGGWKEFIRPGQRKLVAGRALLLFRGRTRRR